MNTAPPAARRPNPKSRRPGRWIPWVGAAALLAFIVAGFWPKPTLVETAAVTVGPLRSTVNEEGKTRIRQRYTVSAPVAGQIRRVPLKAGDAVVCAETIVAVIDPVRPSLLDPRARDLAAARRDSASARLARAKSEHEFAASDLRRNQTLFDQKTISKQELDQFQLREASTAADVNAADAALREAEAEMREFANPSGAGAEPVTLRAPVSGRVLKVTEESARAVPAGAPLLEIGDPNDLEVAIEVLSRDGAEIQPGTPVELEQWGGSKPLQARVRLVEPAAFTKVSALGVEEQRVNVVADLLTPPAGRGNLGDSFRVEARIITWQGDRVLQIPNGALFRKASQWNVYLVASGRSELRNVTPGRSSGTDTEIVSGLKEGEQVILYPGDRMRPGLRVKVVRL
jgi:HlyD family secretion protein